MDDRNYRNRLTSRPSGRACGRGLRITVCDELSCLAAGVSVDEPLADLPDLSRENVLACLAYAADRKCHSFFAAG